MMCIFWISLILNYDISSFTLDFLELLTLSSGFAPPVTAVESFSMWNVIIITLCTYLYACLWMRKPLEAWTYLVIIICSFVWEAVSHYDLFFLTFGVFVFEVQHVNLSQIISKGKWKMDSLRRNNCQHSVYNNV